MWNTQASRSRQSEATRSRDDVPDEGHRLKGRVLGVAIVRSGYLHAAHPLAPYTKSQSTDFRFRVGELRVLRTADKDGAYALRRPLVMVPQGIHTVHEELRLRRHPAETDGGYEDQEICVRHLPDGERNGIIEHASAGIPARSTALAVFAGTVADENCR